MPVRIKRSAIGIALAFVAIGAMMDAGRPAQAQWHPSPYPWCAHLGTYFGGYEDCAYFTFGQCMATISGVGGRCYENPSYVPPMQPRRSRKYRRPAR